MSHHVSFAYKTTFLNGLLPALLLVLPACTLGVDGNGQRTEGTVTCTISPA